MIDGEIKVCWWAAGWFALAWFVRLFTADNPSEWEIVPAIAFACLAVGMMTARGPDKRGTTTEREPPEIGRD